MTARYDLPYRLITKGRQELTHRYIGKSRVYLGALLEAMQPNGIWHQLRRYKEPDGTRIKVESVFGEMTITIDTTNTVTKEELINMPVRESEEEEGNEEEAAISCVLYTGNGKLFSEMWAINLVNNISSDLISKQSASGRDLPFDIKWMGKTYDKIWSESGRWKTGPVGNFGEVHDVHWPNGHAVTDWGGDPDDQIAGFAYDGLSTSQNENEPYGTPRAGLWSGEVTIDGQTRRVIIDYHHVAKWFGPLPGVHASLMGNDVTYEFVYLDKLYDADGQLLCPAAIGWFFREVRWGNICPSHQGPGSGPSSIGEYTLPCWVGVALGDQVYFYHTDFYSLENNSYWSVLNDDGYPVNKPTSGVASENHWSWGFGPIDVDPAFVETTIKPL